MEIYVNYLAIEVTRRCNMKCNHCLRGDAQNLDISTAVLSGIAKHIHPASVIFTGGEPSLNVPAIKRYFELAERYDTMPAAFYVATNGATSKEQMRNLALTLLESYAKMEEQDMCEVDVSVDMFHEAFRDNDNAKILSGLSFFGQGKQHSVRDDDLNWLLNTGRANKNGIGVRAPEVLRTDMDELVTDYSTEYNSIAFDTLYIAANGNVVDGCDSSYEDIHGEKEVRELGEYLLYIHHQALQMAGPLSFPCIYGVSTTNEWVVREFIPDKEGNPCIYHGLPLHTEYRVFVDCDSDAVIGVSPYWEPKTMLNRFGSCSDANSPHQMHDYVIFKSHEATLMRRYHENVDSVVEHIREFLPALDLQGQWSIDVMQNGDDFWIIDMAVAENSAFYDCVPESLRRPSAENWIPDILKPNN